MAVEREIRRGFRRLNTSGSLKVVFVKLVRRRSDGSFGVRNIEICVLRGCWSGISMSLRNRRPIAPRILVCRFVSVNASATRQQARLRRQVS